MQRLIGKKYGMCKRMNPGCEYCTCKRPWALCGRRQVRRSEDLGAGIGESKEHQQRAVGIAVGGKKVENIKELGPVMECVQGGTWEGKEAFTGDEKCRTYKE